MSTKLIFLVLCSMVSMATGIILTVKGSPYNPAISAVHKLSAVAAIVFFVLMAVPLIKTNAQGITVIAVLAVLAVMLIIAIVSGAVILNSFNAILMQVHRISPFLAYAFGIAAMIMLNAKAR